MSISKRIVRIAAGSLPKSLRERYREQWLADVRDAPEQGLRPAQIAVGSIAFAVTVGRPFPKRRDLSSAEVDRRVRIAVGLALSGAVLGLSQWASMFSGQYLGDNIVPDAPTYVLSTSLIACSAFASVLALILAFITRGISARSRWAVVLFAIASVSPIVQSSLNAGATISWDPALRPSAIPYLAGAVLVLAGLALVRSPRRTDTPNRRASITAGAVVLLVAAVTLVNAVVLWSLRPPLRFAAGPRRASNPIYVQWLHLKEQFEALMTSIFMWWGVGAVVIVVTFILFAIVKRLSSPEIARRALGASALSLIAGGGLLGFLQLAEIGIVPPAETSLVLSAGRLALVGAILFAARAGVAAESNGGRSTLTGEEKTPPTSQLSSRPARESAG